MKTIKRILIIIIIAIVLIIAYYTKQGYNMFQNAITEQTLSKKVESIKQNENYTKLDEMPDFYKNAVIAVEDHRFYDHNGVDIISIARAIKHNISLGKLTEGGSTITQQLAKNTYFTQDKKITRKIAEIFMALEFEENYSKDEIFEFYLNTSYFGDGYYSVKEAAKGYFDKDPKDMTKYECTMLAGIPNAPSVYAPTKNPDLAQQRQKQVLNKMVKYKYITEEEMEEILKN